MRDNRLSVMGLARGSIDADADKVVRKLARNGFQAYLVGGCVRDLLLDRTPKDFDVATSATPSEIRELFRNCRIIGRRFRLAHIFFGQKIIETSTFRANPRPDPDTDDVDSLLIRRDNVFGSVTEDARRRDFTINGLFYDVETEKVIDHVGGMSDLNAQLVRTIGSPAIRFQEDPVRMLRAIKFAARLGFEIEAATYRALIDHRGDLAKCAPPRILEEFYRLLRGGAARRSMQLLTETGLDEVLAPRLAALFRETPTSASIARAKDEEEAAWLATWADESDEPECLPLNLKFAPDEEMWRRRRVAWKVLDQLDMLATHRFEMSNSMLLAAIFNPFLAPSMLAPGVRPGDANEMILELGQPLLDSLRVARRDAERMRQTLLAQRRMTSPRRRRGRPASALTRREYYADAMMVHEVTAVAAADEDVSPGYWRELLEREGLSRPAVDDNNRRRRRRGGRRRRRGGDDLD